MSHAEIYFWLAAVIIPSAVISAGMTIQQAWKLFKKERGACWEKVIMTGVLCWVLICMSVLGCMTLKA